MEFEKKAKIMEFDSGKLLGTLHSVTKAFWLTVVRELITGGV